MVLTAFCTWLLITTNTIELPNRETTCYMTGHLPESLPEEEFPFWIETGRDLGANVFLTTDPSARGKKYKGFIIFPVTIPR